MTDQYAVVTHHFNRNIETIRIVLFDTVEEAYASFSTRDEKGEWHKIVEKGVSHWANGDYNKWPDYSQTWVRPVEGGVIVLRAHRTGEVTQFCDQVERVVYDDTNALIHVEEPCPTSSDESETEESTNEK
jgi:hypothetical protein